MTKYVLYMEEKDFLRCEELISDNLQELKKQAICLYEHLTEVEKKNLQYFGIYEIEIPKDMKEDFDELYEEGEVFLHEFWKKDITLFVVDGDIL